MAKNKFTTEQVVTALQQTKGMVTLAARQLGCAPNTIRRYIREYAKVADAQHEASEMTGDLVELALYDEAVNKRNTAALIFLAKTKFKDRGYVERMEIDIRYVQIIKQIEALSEKQGIEASDLFNDLLTELSTASRAEVEGAE